MSSGTVRRTLQALVASALAAGLVGLAGTGRAAAAPSPPYRPPVDAPVVDAFRPPERPYGPGNRGLEYGTAAGAEVRAAADGTVVFAGTVAGSRHVTLLHADGVRTSYSFLDEVAVVVGQRVSGGDHLGTTAGHLHLGARRGDEYFDPASLFDPDPPPVRLVPFDLPMGVGAEGERSAIGQLIGGLGSAARTVGGAAASSFDVAADWLRDGAPRLATLLHYASRFAPGIGHLDMAMTLVGAHQQAQRRAARPCSSGPAPAPPPERRVALLVAGLGSNGSSSTVDDVDTGTLGYADADVVRFSYAGGRTPDPTDGLTGLPAAPYEAADTEGDVRETARRLADLIEAVAAEAPGAPIDLYAHSLGGVVARLALLELSRRHGEAWLAQVGLLATMGSPHGGADIATAVHAWSTSGTGRVALEGIGAVAEVGVDPTANLVAQLSETSDVVAELEDNPVPAIVPAVSVAARGDLIVPVPRSVAPGMDEVVVPLVGPDAHSDLPGDPRTTTALALARAELPPPCQSYRAALTDALTGEAISYGEDLAGALGWALAVRSDLPR